ncbi:class I SAM-dependent methyltransferase [Edaphobacter paludis]|uniref:Class I SAM-dependent methyltransferase n=1 Tax=Edaphobacter paludis TaxID=3035702 RepID=A0AAU7DC67_9BACT
MDHLKDWFVDGTRDWWGVRPPSPNQRQNRSDLWVVNAVMTLHHVRPSYCEELRLERAHFSGKRVLEVGSGPLAPILQFSGCIRHCLDPLVNMYMAAGWPLYDYDAKFVSMGGERMPYPDAYFDSVISVNALDHVDDFGQVASEMHRVVKPGGSIDFEVEYHAPTVPEPIEMTDEKVLEAFHGFELKPVISRTGHEMFETLASRFDLIPNQFERFGKERFVTWHGIKI